MAEAEMPYHFYILLVRLLPQGRMKQDKLMRNGNRERHKIFSGLVRKMARVW